MKAKKETAKNPKSPNPQSSVVTNSAPFNPQSSTVVTNSALLPKEQEPYDLLK